MAYIPPYSPQGYMNYGQQFQTSMPMQQMPLTTFINVPSEEVARRWDVAPNRTERFIDDNRGYFYSKSVGASILEPPVFKKYKIVEEAGNFDAPQASTAAAAEVDLSDYMTKSEFESYKSIIDDMQEIVKELKGDGKSSGTAKP